jgi:hypothetical protein
VVFAPVRCVGILRKEEISKMAKIQRNAVSNDEAYSVGLNIILWGSKKRTVAENEQIISTGAVRVLIVDAADEARVLLDETAEAKQFSTGSVGFGLNTRNISFSQS